MPQTKRLSRPESRALTREKLIAAGARAFLRHGLGAAVVEDIAEEAGFSRGAFYSNFSSREDFFLAVLDRRLDVEFENLERIHHSDRPPEERLRLLRDAYVAIASNKESAILFSEYQANALRNPKIRRSFVERNRRIQERGARILVETAESLKLTLASEPVDIIAALQILCQGIGVDQILVKSERDRLKSILTLCFNRLIGLETNISTEP